MTFSPSWLVKQMLFQRRSLFSTKQSIWSTAQVFFLTKSPACAPRQRNDTRPQLPDNRTMKRPARFSKLSPVDNVRYLSGTLEDNIAGRNLTGFKVEILQQVLNPRLHSVFPRKIVSPTLIAVFRPRVGLFVQHLERVPGYCLTGLLYRIAAWVQSEDVQFPTTRKCSTSRIEYYPRFMLQIRWDVLGKILDHCSVLT